MTVGNQLGYLATSRALSLHCGQPSSHCAMTGLRKPKLAPDASTGCEHDLVEAHVLYLGAW
jgi:hypothetical protein